MRVSFAVVRAKPRALCPGVPGANRAAVVAPHSNAPGTMSMANTGRPNSGGSQFFLNVADNARLDWFSGGRSKHPVFAKITSGYDVVVAISKVRTKGSAPIVPIKMKSITISGVTSSQLNHARLLVGSATDRNL